MEFFEKFKALPKHEKGLVLIIGALVFFGLLYFGVTAENSIGLND